MNTPSPRPPRQRVLVVPHPDGHLEVFGERNIAVHVARVPIAHSRDAERVADEVVDLRLPRPFRELHRADKLRAVGTTRPLRPSALLAAAETRDALAALDALAAEPQEVVACIM